jgi:PilZ domain-containing protein
MPIGAVPRLSDAPADPLDRRGSRRQGGAGSAMGAFYDPTGDMTLIPIRLVDRSRGGLGISTPVPVLPGSRFTLYGDDLPIPHMYGTVVRCAGSPGDYRLGLRCDARLAA